MGVWEGVVPFVEDSNGTYKPRLTWKWHSMKHEINGILQFSRWKQHLKASSKQTKILQFWGMYQDGSVRKHIFMTTKSS